MSCDFPQIFPKHVDIHADMNAVTDRNDAKVPDIVKKFQRQVQENQLRHERRTVTFVGLTTNFQSNKAKFEALAQTLNETGLQREQTQNSLGEPSQKDPELTEQQRALEAAVPVLIPSEGAAVDQPPLRDDPAQVVERIRLEENEIMDVFFGEGADAPKKSHTKTEFKNAAVRKVLDERTLALKKLESLEEVLRERDNESKLKRKGPYYLALQPDHPSRLIWKPLTTKSLHRKERKEFRKAFEHILGILQTGIDHSIRDIKDGEYPGSEISLVLLLDKVLSRKWCQTMLKRERESAMRRSLIYILYQIQFNAPLENARLTKLFLTNNRPKLERLIKLLSDLQVKTLSQGVSEILEIGSPHVQPMALSNSNKRVTEKVFGVISPRVRQIMEAQQKQRDVSYTEHRACFEAIKALKRQHDVNAMANTDSEGQPLLKEKDKIDKAPSGELPADREQRLIAQLGIAAVYNDCPEEEQPGLVARIVTHPELLLGLFNDRTGIADVSESLEAYASNIDTYLNFHQKWKVSDQNLLKFIQENVSGEKAEKAVRFYREGDFSESLRIVFQHGTMNLTFRKIMRFLFKNAFAKLAEHQVPDPLFQELKWGLEDAVPGNEDYSVNLDKTAGLLAKTLTVFARLNLA